MGSPRGRKLARPENIHVGRTGEQVCRKPASSLAQAAAHRVLAASHHEQRRACAAAEARLERRAVHEPVDEEELAALRGLGGGCFRCFLGEVVLSCLGRGRGTFIDFYTGFFQAPNPAETSNAFV